MRVHKYPHCNRDKKKQIFSCALITQFGDRMSQVGCEGSVYVRLQSGQIQFDDLIVLGVRVRRQQALVLIGGFGDFRASGRLQVILHPVIVREERGGGADLGTHVANGCHSRAADAVDARTKVLHDGTGTALDGEDTGHFQNDVLGTGPTLELARELHADHLRALELPRDVRHNVDGIGATDADAQATKTAAIRRVRIGTDHQQTREGIVLEDDLMNDTGAGIPEAHAVLSASGLQKIVDLLVDVLGALEIFISADLRLDQVIAVDGRGHCNLR